MKILTLDLGETIGYAWFRDGKLHGTCILGTTRKLSELRKAVSEADRVIVERVAKRNYQGNILLGELKAYLRRKKMLDKLIEQQAYIVRTARKAVKTAFPKLRCSEHERDALCHLWRFLKKRKMDVSFVVERRFGRLTK